MLSVPSSFSRREAGPGRPALMYGTSYGTELCISAVADNQVAHRRACPLVFAATHSAAR